MESKIQSSVGSKFISARHVYILNESGVKIPLAYILQKDEKTLEIRLADGYKYSAGATYYLFIEEGVKTNWQQTKRAYSNEIYDSTIT